MDSVVEDEKKHDQRLEEKMKIFEYGGDRCLQKMIKIKKRPPRCHEDEKKHDQRLEETVQQSFLTPEESERLNSGGNGKNVQLWK
ncbi:hypothetical protein AAG906_034291 [Vitis piasezkii]